MPSVIASLSDPVVLAGIFLLFWFGGAAVMSRLAGWHLLNARYHAPARLKGTEYRFATVSMGRSSFPIRYRRCVRVFTNAEGLGLCLMFPFRFHSPAFFAPWHAVTACTEKQSFTTRTVTWQFEGCDRQVTFIGPLGQELKAGYTQAGGHIQAST